MNKYQVPLKQFIRENHELVILSRKTDWDYLDNELSMYCCFDNGRFGIPISKISGILVLKRMFNESDESVIAKWAKPWKNC